MRKVLYISYFVTLLCMTIFSYLFVDSNLFYLKILFSNFSNQHRVVTTIIYAIFILILFSNYGLFIREYLRKRLGAKEVKKIIFVTVFILLFSYSAMLSFDIFNYLATAKIAYFYKENPYIVMPIEFANEPLLMFMHAANKTALYGPFWIVLTAVLFLFGIGNFLLTLFAFKIFAAIFYIGACFMIHQISRDWFRVLLFGMNPLVIIETLVSGHNDIVMMFLALFSFYFLMNKKIIWAFVFLVLSILIKFATLFLVPIFFYSAWRIWQKQKISWEFTLYLASISMFVIFLLSPILKEEMYSWYGIWFLVFAVLTSQKRFINVVFYTLSFSLLLRYIPFMLLGTYFGQTPLLKIILTIIPLLFVPFYLFKRKLWSRLFFHR